MHRPVHAHVELREAIVERLALHGEFGVFVDQTGREELARSWQAGEGICVEQFLHVWPPRSTHGGFRKTPLGPFRISVDLQRVFCRDDRSGGSQGGSGPGSGGLDSI